VVAGLEGGPARGRVRDELPRIDLARERAVATTADEQPARQSRSTTAAIAWPWPMHMVASP
jgi:hypothetical protein